MQENLTYNHQLVRTNQVTLNVVQAGPREGEPVILLHGFPEFWYGWRHQIDYLARTGFRVWVPDQRGYNLSDKPPGIESYKIEELVRDVIGLIHAMGQEHVNLIGHDWGAMVAWWTALYHPDKVRRLGILNVPHPYVMDRTVRRDIRQTMKSWHTGMFQIPLLPERLLRAGNWRALSRTTRGSGNPGSFTDADMERYREAWSRPGAMKNTLHWYRAYVQKRPAPPDDWRISIPTLMIWGVNDPYLSSRMAQPSIDLCDDGQLHLLEDATHWVQHDEPEQVNRLLHEFLS